MLVRPDRSTSRRTVLAGASAAALTAGLAACGRSGTGDSRASAPISVTDGPATGTVEFWAGAPDGDSLPPFIAAFKKENPDVTVNVTTIPSSEFDTKLTAAIASGRVPDLVSLYSQTQSSILATGAFQTVPEGLVDLGSFFEPALAGVTTADGAHKAVPWYAYARVNYYRKDVVDGLGLTPPTTWEENEAFCRQLVAAGHSIPLGMAVAWDEYSAEALSEYVHQNGSSLTTEDGKGWAINAAANVQALEYFASLFTAGYSSPDGPAFLDVVPWLTSGKNVVNVSNGPWLPGWIDEAAGEGYVAKNIGVYAQPAGPGGAKAAALGGGSLGVLDRGGNAQAAWKLVEYLSRPQVQVQWYQTFGNLPAVQSAWDDPAIADDELLAPVRDAIPTAFGAPTAATWSQVADVIGKQMEQVVRGGSTAQAALDEAQKQAEALGTGA
ncbi:extracellular solute-binding protein [Kineococcus rhizosphaerae]|uniref:Carbohydrate ABC transporter substrate-binding protein (CUT1 family) n=1 Tax=Kineococcus rhizosphaerae TaxID=559628 RepID=A0A2T0R6U6_9ACTN|nr:extracellular solute-binding protein [Kineococcus rhizosphaerae]PRY16896.1 carbohydrate ABC transporter substrate-binding protein (CUT1 family) [Kineococcus rhizosphaerae]